MVDHHTHIVGTGDSGSGCYLNDRIFSLTNNPIQYVKMRAFMSGCGLQNFRDADVSMVERLVDLISAVNLNVNADTTDTTDTVTTVRAHSGSAHPKHYILAFDEVYLLDGSKSVPMSTFHVPNDYVLRLARQYPDHFMPCVSIHPYRADAVAELRRCHRAGARLVKWLPNSMRIDATNSKCAPFLDAMKELNMTLLCHVGEEHSVDMCGLDNELGNPLRLRSVLDRGVRVIAAHCATEGYCNDLDNVDQASGTPPRVECFDMFLRLMDESKYKCLLFGDISAVLAFRRIGYLGRLMDRTDLHPRLCNGSDYPVPALNIVVHTGKLVKAGLMTSDQKVAIDEIYSNNPLLFDFCAKRVLRSANGNKFSDCIFRTNPAAFSDAAVGVEQVEVGGLKK
jgi:hypothetical protein